MKKIKINSDVLRRRFRIRKRPDTESVDLSGFSTFCNLLPPEFFDSDVWAVYEATFPEHAREFYIASGADKYNHDALDLEIEKRYLDELAHYAEQYERHLAILKSIRSGVIQERRECEERLERLDQRLEELRKELESKKSIYGSFFRKAVD